VIVSVHAFAKRTSRTSAALKAGFRSSTRAAPPATWGQAMEVPLIVLPPVSLLTSTDKMLLPGAQMSVHSPKFEKDDFSFFEFVLETTIADGTKEGDMVQDSRLLLPAATTTVTPAAVAASIVSLQPSFTTG